MVLAAEVVGDLVEERLRVGEVADGLDELGDVARQARGGASECEQCAGEVIVGVEPVIGGLHFDK
jgi:hypothetical protein